jgi:hypothetical protein
MLSLTSQFQQGKKGCRPTSITGRFSARYETNGVLSYHGHGRDGLGLQGEVDLLEARSGKGVLFRVLARAPGRRVVGSLVEVLRIGLGRVVRSDRRAGLGCVSSSGDSRSSRCVRGVGSPGDQGSPERGGLPSERKHA